MYSNSPDEDKQEEIIKALEKENKSKMQQLVV